MDDILPDETKAKVFSLVDARNGFWQVSLEEEASLLTTMAPPFGRYCWRRLPFGISPAPEILQQKLDEAILGLVDVKAIADDILVFGEGETQEEAEHNHDQ